MTPQQCLTQDWLGGPLWLTPFAGGMILTLLLLWLLGYFRKEKE
jgi:hypothetical protein